MDTQLNFLPASPILPSVLDGASTASQSSTPAIGGEFSALLTGQMLKAERQLFAAQALDGTGLQVLPLGSKIKLITSDGPVPDMASLAEFARTQGLDEAAVQSLFGENTVPANLLVSPPPTKFQLGLSNFSGFTPGSWWSVQPPPTIQEPSPNRPGKLLTQTAELIPASPELLLPQVPGSTGQVNRLPPHSETPSSVISVSGAQVVKSIKDLPLLQSAPALSPGHPVRQMLPLAATPTPTPTSTAAQDLVALGAASPIIANSNFASWMPLKASTWVDASTAADTNAVNSEVAIQDAVRLTIIPPNQVVTKRLAQMSGNSEPNTWTTLLAGNTIPASTLATAKEWETLQLGIPDELPGSTGQVNGLPPRSETPSSVISVSGAQVVKSIKDLPLLQSAPALSPGHPVRQMLPLAATPTPTPTSTAAQDLVALGAASPIIANSNFASWMPLKASTWVDASTAADTNAVNSEVAIQDAVRLTIIPPNQVVTKRLAQMSGNSEPNTWTTLLAGNTIPASTLATAKEWETLQLGIPDDLLLTLLDRPQESPVSDSFDNSANSPRLGEAMAIPSPGASHHAKSEPTNLSAQVEQRFIQQQQLADKLAQALAQRLVGQMERGQWKIQMRLQPENLGQIEVELKLHAGGLDALFSAENPLTRELITQGSGKLKDSLTQTGMAVASVWVNGDQNRQSGGNSTPWNSFNATASAATGKPDSVEEVVASEKDGAAVTDGLNIWA